jgi:uncharacterized protein YeaO (DUF488 family)
VKLLMNLKRVYDSPEPEDGLRILVDRLWPRGMKKEAAQLDYWLKEVAPITELRKWFHQGSGSFEDFQKLYLDELGLAARDQGSPSYPSDLGQSISCHLVVWSQRPYY